MITRSIRPNARALSSLATIKWLALSKEIARKI
jgi:hypothetical protein